jgi:hypothetical protein
MTATGFTPSDDKFLITGSDSLYFLECQVCRGRASLETRVQNERVA